MEEVAGGAVAEYVSGGHTHTSQSQIITQEAKQAEKKQKRKELE